MSCFEFSYSTAKSRPYCLNPYLRLNDPRPDSSIRCGTEPILIAICVFLRCRARPGVIFLALLWRSALLGPFSGFWGRSSVEQHLVVRRIGLGPQSVRIPPIAAAAAAKANSITIVLQGRFVKIASSK